MRPGVLALFALLTTGVVAPHAEEPVPPPATNAPAIGAAPGTTAANPTVSAPPPAPIPSAESKADKQPLAETAKAPPSARFTFQRVDDGFLRFDYETGHVAFCNARPGGWGCQAVPENRSKLEREVEQLRGEVADLKSRLNKQDEPPRPPQPIPPQSQPAAPAPNPGSGVTFSVPGRDHIARAASAVQDAWQHFVDMVTAFKDDMLRKSGA